MTGKDRTRNFKRLYTNKTIILYNIKTVNFIVTNMDEVWRKYLDLIKVGPTRFPTRKVQLCADPEYREIKGENNLKVYPGGSLASVYTSNTGLPQLLPEDIFRVEKETTPRILLYEKIFEQNVRNLLDTLDMQKGTYFIGDCGVSHLFGIAKALRERGIDVAFYIAKKAFPVSEFAHNIRTATDAALYYAEEFETTKNVPLQSNFVGTMIDYHRTDSPEPAELDVGAFADIDSLKSRGITRVIVLGEDFATSKGEIREKEADLARVLQLYQSNGFEVEVARIDSRKPFEFKPLIKF